MNRLAVFIALAGAPPGSGWSGNYLHEVVSGQRSEFVSIQVQKDGTTVYKEAADDEDPVSFKIPPEDVQMIFGLAETLNQFQTPLESGLKVANMGKKTFAWQDGATKHESSFNFSLDENAKTLLDWFERVSETQQLYFILERSVKFDKLGVNKAILAGGGRSRSQAPGGSGTFAAVAGSCSEERQLSPHGTRARGSAC